MVTHAIAPDGEDSMPAGRDRGARITVTQSGSHPMVTSRSIRSYRELIAWQRAMELVVVSYRTASRLPRDELYGLISQIRRAATSVPANIAEGQGRRGT